MPYQHHIITSGNLGTLLWEHHFGIVLGSPDQLGLPEFSERSQRYDVVTYTKSRDFCSARDIE